MNEKKILFIYSNMGDGGTQRQKSILSRELSKKYNLTMALFKNEQLHKFYGNIIDLKAPTSKNFFIMLRNSIRRIVLLRKLFKSNNYDIVISSSVIANFFSLFVKFLFRIKIPIIITFNNANKLKSQDMGILGRFVALQNRLFSQYADCIVTVSKALKNELLNEDYPAEKIRTIYNGLNIKEIKKLSREKIESDYRKMYNNDFFKIISIGRLSVQKDYFSLLRAFKIVREKLPGKLIILGDGELKDDLLREIKELNIEGDVYLQGWVKNPYKLLAHSDLFVLSSLWEGFPNVVLEALGCDLPVIATDCPTGPNEIIESGKNGLLVPVNDYYALAKKILSILQDKKMCKKIRKAGTQRVQEFDIKKIALEWAAVIEDTLEFFKATYI